MSDRSMLARLFPRWGRRRSRPVHPSIGLPADAPGYLETPNGSFVRVLPESEYIPLKRKADAWWKLVIGIVIAFFVLLPAIFAVMLILEERGMSEWEIVDFLMKAIIGDFLLLIPVILLILFQPWYRALSMPKLLSRRPSRMFGPGEVSGIMSFRHGDTRDVYKDPDDFALFRIGEGFIEFELSRAQVRIAAQDLTIFPVEEEASALMVKARLRDFPWSVAAKYIAFFEWRRLSSELLDGELMTKERYSRLADMVLARVGTVPGALTETGGNDPRATESDTFTVEACDSIIRVSPDGFDVTSDGIHQFFLGWDEIKRVRWRESANLVFSGGGRKIVIAESDLNEDQIERIETRLVHFDVSEVDPWPLGFVACMLLINITAVLLLYTIAKHVPVRYLIMSASALFVAIIFHYKVIKRIGKTHFYRRKTMKDER